MRRPTTPRHCHGIAKSGPGVACHAHADPWGLGSTALRPRRDEGFSTLRLHGGTPALAAVLTVVESTLAAVVGILAGMPLCAVALPAVALIPFQGRALGLENL
ncbi:MAG: hypothetical protein ABI563_14820 [Specibacter sp.]